MSTYRMLNLIVWIAQMTDKEVSATIGWIETKSEFFLSKLMCTFSAFNRFILVLNLSRLHDMEPMYKYTNAH